MYGGSGSGLQLSTSFSPQVFLSVRTLGICLVSSHQIKHYGEKYKDPGLWWMQTNKLCQRVVGYGNMDTGKIIYMQEGEQWIQILYYFAKVVDFMHQLLAQIRDIRLGGIHGQVRIFTIINQFCTTKCVAIIGYFP